MAMYPCLSLPSLSYPTLTGSIVSFNAQYALPLKSHKVALTATQSGSGTPSPDNVRSINGRSDIAIGNCDSDIAQLWTIDSSFTGAVLFNQIYNYTSGSTTGLGVIRSITNGLISFSGESTSAGNSVTFAWTDFTVTNGHKVIVLKDFTLPEGDYIFDQYNGYGNVDITNTIMNISAGFMIPQLKVSGAGHDYTGISGHLSVIDLTVMFGSTIADYIYNLEQSEAGAGVAFFKHMYPDNYYPYNAGTKEGVGVSTVIQIGSTVYGGEYDARTGVLTATKASVILDSSNVPTSEAYVQYNSSTDVYSWTHDQILVGVTNQANVICDKLSLSGDAYNRTSGGKFYCYTGIGERIYVSMEGSVVGSKAGMIQWLRDNTPLFVYELATPIEIQLPPCPIDTLQGVNNIWADTGDTTLQYPKFG